MRDRVVERFWSKIEKGDSCWIWTGAHTKRGYGRLFNGIKYVSAHRFSFQLLSGPIPDGLELDHLCRNHACVNPDHLEPVSHRENVRRGVAGDKHRALTRCSRGHEFTDSNTLITTKGWRRCRVCAREVWSPRARAKAGA